MACAGVLGQEEEMGLIAAADTLTEGGKVAMALSSVSVITNSLLMRRFKA